MPRPSLSHSVNVRQPEIGGPPPAEKEDFGSLRDAPLSPESKSSFGMDLERSPLDSGMDVPPSQEGQDALCVDADLSFESRRSFGMGSSTSPLSQYSFGMDSFPGPEDEQDFGMDAQSSPKVGGQGVSPQDGTRAPLALEDFGMDSPLPTEAGEPVGSISAAHDWNWGQRAPSPGNTIGGQGESTQDGTLGLEALVPAEAQELSVGALPALEDFGMDPLLPTEAVESVGSLSAERGWKWGQRAPSHGNTVGSQGVGPQDGTRAPLALEDFGMDSPLPTEAVEPVGSLSAERGWKWGQRAPSPGNTEMQEAEGSANPGTDQTQENSELQEVDELTPAAILRGEAIRLRRIRRETQVIYQREIYLSHVIDSMVVDLNDATL